MMRLLNVVAAIACALLGAVSGFSVGEISRREAFQAAVGGLATIVAPSLIATLPVNAVVDEETPRSTTRMGGLLVRFLALFVDPCLDYVHFVIICGLTSK